MKAIQLPHCKYDSQMTTMHKSNGSHDGHMEVTWPVTWLIHLLQFEDVMDKELLKVLVAEVDAELLKTVGLKRLKTKDV